MKTVTISRTGRGRVNCSARLGKQETDGSFSVELTPPDLYSEVFFSPDMPEVNMDEGGTLYRLRRTDPVKYFFIARPSNERL